MDEVLSRLNPKDITGIIVVFLAFVAGLTIWLSLQWRLHRRTEMEAALKQDMLKRGMSAEEIERVIHASLGHGHSGEGPKTADSSRWART
jgi:hypothetical protein